MIKYAPGVCKLFKVLDIKVFYEMMLLFDKVFHLSEIMMCLEIHKLTFKIINLHFNSINFLLTLQLCLNHCSFHCLNLEEVVLFKFALSVSVILNHARSIKLPCLIFFLARSFNQLELYPLPVQLLCHLNVCCLVITDLFIPLIELIKQLTVLVSLVSR